MRNTRTLLRLAEEGRAGRLWYETAANQIRDSARRLKVSPHYLASLLALFSPRVSVLRSVKWTIHYINTGTFLPDVTIHHRTAIAHYHATGEIRGPKTAPFARALLGDVDAVVLDVWMSRALAIPQKHLERRHTHQRATRTIQRTASLLGWPPAHTQAAIWCAVVRRHGRNPPEFPLATRNPPAS